MGAFILLGVPARLFQPLGVPDHPPCGSSPGHHMGGRGAWDALSPSRAPSRPGAAFFQAASYQFEARMTAGRAGTVWFNLIHSAGRWVATRSANIKQIKTKTKGWEPRRWLGPASSCSAAFLSC